MPADFKTGVFAFNMEEVGRKARVVVGRRGPVVYPFFFFFF